MTTETTTTLTAATLGYAAHKMLPNGEYVEVEAADPDCTSYILRRAYFGNVQWEDTASSAAVAVKAVAHWGLDNWTPALHGEYA